MFRSIETTSSTAQMNSHCRRSRGYHEHPHSADVCAFAHGWPWSRAQRIAAAFMEACLDDIETIQKEIDELADEIAGLGDEIAVMTGREIADLCEKHGALCCFGEDLSQANEWAGRSYRWVRGKQQEWIICLCRRVGCAHMFVNASNTSQMCAKCGCKVKHDDEGRISTCEDDTCSFSEDRDRMASWVIAKRGLKGFSKYRKKVLYSDKE